MSWLRRVLCLPSKAGYGTASRTRLANLHSYPVRLLPTSALDLISKLVGWVQIPPPTLLGQITCHVQISLIPPHLNFGMRFWFSEICQESYCFSSSIQSFVLNSALSFQKNHGKFSIIERLKNGCSTF